MRQSTRPRDLNAVFSLNIKKRLFQVSKNKLIDKKRSFLRASDARLEAFLLETMKNKYAYNKN